MGTLVASLKLDNQLKVQDQPIFQFLSFDITKLASVELLLLLQLWWLISELVDFYGFDWFVWVSLPLIATGFQLIQNLLWVWFSWDRTDSDWIKFGCIWPVLILFGLVWLFWSSLDCLDSHLEINAIPLAAQILQPHLPKGHHYGYILNTKYLRAGLSLSWASMLSILEPALVGCLAQELPQRENLSQHCRSRPE